jgi:A/G-specific adenine glycosylase
VTASISDHLLAWYDVHARDLPWRSPPGAALPGDPAWPYRVWLSEVMLQQTTVAAVKPYFAKFTAIWPTVEALAAARDDDVMAAWAGLGYYSRARNLVKCARAVAERGGFPATEAELRGLPGLGDYTAAAIAAIAFGERAVVVDANVERVVARLFAITDPLPGGRKAIRAATGSITPAARAGDFAQAMMDLGSQICTTKAPRCLLCPLAAACAGRKAGEPEGLPVKPAKKAVPDDGWTARKDGSGEAPLPGETRVLGAVRHGFTHAQLTLLVVAVAADATPAGEGQWWPVAAIAEAGLATLFLKAARLAKAASD